MNNKLIREIYESYQEYKDSHDEYRDFLDSYVEMIILEKPQNMHENYFTYWEALKKTESVPENVWCEIVEDVYRSRK